MSIRLTDTEIQQLIGEPKPLAQNFIAQTQLREKRGHRERELDTEGSNGSLFRLILRQNSYNILDFSVILAYLTDASSQVFRLRRYNGKSHEHTNKIECQTFYDFHVHLATERYQSSGFREDSYAEPTNRYGNFQGALDSMIEDCGLILPSNHQKLLF